jgi:predicted kinase
MLHILCGKIASGKSSLAAELSAPNDAILLSEDDWLGILFGAEMTTLQDYVRCAGKLRTAMKPHIEALLRSGLTVVLDFQANTVDSRAWMRGLVEDSGAAHQLHFLDVADAVCLERLHARNAEGTHPFTVSDAQFHQVTQHFVAPTAEEGFTIIRHTVPS